MTHIKVGRVLVGVDFDDASAAALQLAASLARTWGAELTAFHATTDDVPAYFTASQIDQLEAEREESHAAVAARVRAFAAKHAAGPFDVLVGEGRAQDALVRLAAGFDVIVLGTHRRHGLPRWWLGSVAEAIVRTSPRPVLVVPSNTALGQRPTILAAGADGAADAWVEALSVAIGGSVVRAPELHRCAPGSVGAADMIVLPVPTPAHLDELTHVLKECRHPVLFVPVTHTLERTSS